MFVYERHLGSLYVTETELSPGELYCGQCGDSDTFIGEANTKEEFWELIKDDVDIDNSGGWSQEYIAKVIAECFGDETDSN